MPVFAGTMLLRRELRTGWVHVERGRFVASGRDDPPERPVATGWIVPSPVNAHTHVADALLRGVPGRPSTVKELFGPNGWKHQHLQRAERGAQDAATRACLDEMAAVGTAGFLDFREGGTSGARWLRGLDGAVAPTIYGRPDGRDDEQLMANVDGIGLSGLRDHPRKFLEQWSDAAHDARKPFAIHVSEDARDDIDAAVALAPRFVVHMTRARPADLEELAHERIPIVACPRSNAAFGARPPVPAMLEAGCTVALGTDNAMLQDGDVFNEARRLAADFPTLSDAALLRMATYHGRDLLGLADPLPAKRGAEADVVVLPADVLRPQAHKPQLGIPTDLDSMGQPGSGTA